jgi:hypothetical protein
MNGALNYPYVQGENFKVKKSSMMRIILDLPKKGGPMFKRELMLTVLAVILLFMPGCNLPAVSGQATKTNQAQAFPPETQAAVLVKTLSAQTALAIAETASLAAQPTHIPEFTFTPSFTPSATFTLTPSKPMVSVSITTNCRSGPTTQYSLLGVLQVGESAEVVGRSVLTDTMIIKLPSNPEVTCWLWAQNATVSGDISKLPIISIPYTPTPVASVSVVYSSTQYCLGLYRFKFKITNNGSTTWESDRVNVTDQNLSITRTVSWDDFPYYTAACDAKTDLNLEAGEIGYTSSDGFALDPTGHDITATILVCSQNGLAGTCLEKMVAFTP